MTPNKPELTSEELRERVIEIIPKLGNIYDIWDMLRDLTALAEYVHTQDEAVEAYKAKLVAWLEEYQKASANERNNNPAPGNLVWGISVDTLQDVINHISQEGE